MMALSHPEHVAAQVRATPAGKARVGEALKTVKASRLSVLPLVYLLCVVLPLGFDLGPLYMTTLRLLLILIILPLAIQLAIGRFGRIIATDILFLAHLLWMTAALAINSPAQVVQQTGSLGVEFLGGYLVGRAYIRSREDFLGLCRLLVLLVLCLAPFALYESFSGRTLIIETLQNIPGVRTVAKVRPDPRMGLFRAQVSFAHAIHFGLFCSVVFSLCFVALKDVLPFGRRFIFSGIIMFSGFLALSSGALLAMALQIALILWATVFARISWRWWLLVGLFALGYVVIDLVSNRAPIQVFMSYATFSAHNAYWRGIIFEWGIKNILGDAEIGVTAAPWFGIGMNDWIRPSFMRSGSMDNFWLVMGVRYGIPGFLLLAIGYGLLIFHVMRRDFQADPRLTQIRRAWVFTFLGLTFTLCTVHVWTNIYSFVFFMFGAGVWLIAAEIQSDKSEPKLESSPKHPLMRNVASSSHAFSQLGPVRQLPHTRFPHVHISRTNLTSSRSDTP